MKFRILPMLLLLCTLSATAQDFPHFMQLSPDGRMITMGKNDNQDLYNQSIIRNIYLDFPQSNYWTLLTQNYQNKIDLPATMTVDGTVYDSVGVRFKGQTSYSQTTSSQKKSFNISTDYVHDAQELMGYKTLNLNNCFQDPSFMREVFFQSQIKRHVPVAQSAFVNLFINNQNWGLYPNVQQLNGDFLKEWFLSNDGTNWRADKPPGAPGGIGMWGDGTAALNYLGNDSNQYKNYYTLKSTDKAQPWGDLITACQRLANTSNVQFDSILNNYLDIDRALWFLASEILFSDDDSYIYKGKMDYYCYWESETGRLTPQEYDGNSVMANNHVNWSLYYNAGNANYPLLARLLSHPDYRQRYLAHMRTLISEVYDTSISNGIIEGYFNQIDSFVLADPKKLYSYNSFIQEKNAIKAWVQNRKNYLSNDIELSQSAPIITDVSYYTNNVQWQVPNANEVVTVKATVTSNPGVSNVKLYYCNGLVGRFYWVYMYDDGLHNDGAAGDGVYAGEIPAQSATSWMRYYVEAISSNLYSTRSYSPVGAEHDVYVYQVFPSLAADTTVVINELMAINQTTASDSYGEYDDWVELHNTSTTTIDLSNYYLSDNELNLTKFQFPIGTSMLPGDYLIIWADEDGWQGPLHANFKLSGSGEKLYLLNANMELLDSISWSQQIADAGFARVPNGFGPFVIQGPTFNYNNNLTNIQEVEAINAISIFPNPANEWLNVSLKGNSESEIVLFDISGRVVQSFPFANDLLINTSNYENGVYFIRHDKSAARLLIQR